jgi:hypothetical protein
MDYNYQTVLKQINKQNMKTVNHIRPRSDHL